MCKYYFYFAAKKRFDFNNVTLTDKDGVEIGPNEFPHFIDSIISVVNTDIVMLGCIYTFILFHETHNLMYILNNATDKSYIYYFWNLKLSFCLFHINSYNKVEFLF